jgi:hypothetical protein
MTHHGSRPKARLARLVLVTALMCAAFSASASSASAVGCNGTAVGLAGGYFTPTTCTYKYTCRRSVCRVGVYVYLYNPSMSGTVSARARGTFVSGAGVISRGASCTAGPRAECRNGPNGWVDMPQGGVLTANCLSPVSGLPSMFKPMVWCGLAGT